MTLKITTVAELAGLICLMFGGFVLGGLGGLVVAAGACLLYEARP